MFQLSELGRIRNHDFKPELKRLNGGMNLVASTEILLLYVLSIGWSSKIGTTF